MIGPVKVLDSGRSGEYYWIYIDNGIKPRTIHSKWNATGKAYIGKDIMYSTYQEDKWDNKTWYDQLTLI